MYAKDLEEPKYQFLIEKREKAGLKHLNNATAFIENSLAMDDIFENIEYYNKKRKRKVLEKVIKELFIRCRKLNFSLCFLAQSYFIVPKDVRLNCTHSLCYF